MIDPRCDCGHMFEICNHPNCALGEAQRPIPIDYADPEERWEGWPEVPLHIKVSGWCAWCGSPDKCSGFECGWKKRRALALSQAQEKT